MHTIFQKCSSLARDKYVGELGPNVLEVSRLCERWRRRVSKRNKQGHTIVVVTASSSVSVYPPKPETLTEPSVVGRSDGFTLGISIVASLLGRGAVRATSQLNKKGDRVG